MEKLLQIKDLYVGAEDKEILKGLNLEIGKGEIHVVMGPNGAGKSTLANAIFNNPQYTKESGSILFEGEDITDAKTDEIARKGIFMSFQAPVTEEPVKAFAFRKEMKDYMSKLKMNQAYSRRELNVGFSGGEKKKNEILQLLMLNPKLAILDETDSGLDVDAVKTVSEGIKMFKNNENSVLIITHNAKILNELEVDYVHVLVDGKIVTTGGSELVEKIEKEGFGKYRVGEEEYE